MKRFKKLIPLISIILILGACSSSEKKYESIQGFEFHFYPEEYDKEYHEISKILPLDVDADYQLQINATCVSGTINLNIIFADEKIKTFTVDEKTPCNELIEIPAKTTKITIIVSINPDTKGKVIGDLLTKK